MPQANAPQQLGASSTGLHSGCCHGQASTSAAGMQQLRADLGKAAGTSKSGFRVQVLGICRPLTPDPDTATCRHILKSVLYDSSMLRASSRALVCDRLQSGRRATGITKQRRPPFPSNPASRCGKGGMCGSWIAVCSPAALAPRLVPGRGWQLYRAHTAASCRVARARAASCCKCMQSPIQLLHPACSDPMQGHVHLTSFASAMPLATTSSHTSGLSSHSSQGTPAASPLPPSLSPTPESLWPNGFCLSPSPSLSLSLSFSLSLSLSPSPSPFPSPPRSPSLPLSLFTSNKRVSVACR